MKKVFFVTCLLASFSIEARLKVITSTSTLAHLVETLGGENVDVQSLTAPKQDPHYVEAKPSYMVKLRQADLLISVGLGLEEGWIGLVRRGSKNPRLQLGKPGSLVTGNFIEAIEVPEGKIDRSQGDIHPEGNPHFHLDPLRMEKVARVISQRMTELMPDKKGFFSKKLREFTTEISKKKKLWKERVLAAKVNQVVTYHKSLNYFLNFFEIELAATIEPKPGVPPVAKHVSRLIQKIKKEKVNCILNENYFELAAAKRVQRELSAHIEVVPVEASKGYFDLMEQLVVAIENCGQAFSKKG